MKSLVSILARASFCAVFVLAGGNAVLNAYAYVDCDYVYSTDSNVDDYIALMERSSAEELREITECLEKRIAEREAREAREAEERRAREAREAEQRRAREAEERRAREAEERRAREAEARRAQEAKKAASKKAATYGGCVKIENAPAFAGFHQVSITNACDYDIFEIGFPYVHLYGDDCRQRTVRGQFYGQRLPSGHATKTQLGTLPENCAWQSKGLCWTKWGDSPSYAVHQKRRANWHKCMNQYGLPIGF